MPRSRFPPTFAANSLAAISLNRDSSATAVAANATQAMVIGRNETKLPFPRGSSGAPPGAHSILSIDFNHDFRTDLVLAGAGGVKLYEQAEDGSFSDITERAIADAAARSANYLGAWAADVDLVERYQLWRLLASATDA